MKIGLAKYCIIMLCLLVFIAAGCGKTRNIINSSADFSEQSVIGLGAGSSADLTIRESFPNVKYEYYDRNEDAYLAVAAGKIDAFAFEDTMMLYAISGGVKGVRLLDERIGEPTDVSIGISPVTKIPDLKIKIDAFIKEIKNNGVYEDMYNRWILRSTAAVEPIAVPKQPIGTLVVGTTGVVEPYSYYKGTELTGFDKEFAERLALYLNMNVEFKIYDYSSIIIAAQQGTIDCISANLNVTEERRKKIDFSIPIYKVNTALMVKNDEAAADIYNYRDFQESIYNNLIKENRYQLILQGLKTTIIISILSAVFGTILGCFICLCRLSKVKIISKLAKLYVSIIRGIPMVVLLLIICYVILIDINAPMLIAAVAFSCNLAAYVAETLRMGILAVEKGQIEAAQAIGFSKIQTYWYVILPQAIRYALPVYKNSLVAMVQSTAIAGYIAIQDLTKASDIIRSRTIIGYIKTPGL